LHKYPHVVLDYWLDTSIAVSDILHWSKGEQNKLFAQIFGRVAELNWMWEKALEDFSKQVTQCMQYPTSIQIMNKFCFNWVICIFVKQFYNYSLKHHSNTFTPQIKSVYIYIIYSTDSGMLTRYTHCVSSSNEICALL